MLIWVTKLTIMKSMENFTLLLTISKWRGQRVWHMNVLLYTYVYLCIFSKSIQCASEDVTDVAAKLSLEYTPNVSLVQINGYYAHPVKVNTAPLKGQLVHVRTLNKTVGTDLGCSEIDKSIVPPKGRWIALVKRGVCDFDVKIYYATKRSNASAVIIYNTQGNKETGTISTNGTYDVTDVVTVFIRKHSEVEKLLSSYNQYQRLNVTITEMLVGIQTTTPPGDGKYTPNNTSVLFVSVSFIVLIIISLAWLVFYYIQRCRYTNAKERLSRRLANAAKKAIAKIPQRPVKIGDKELDNDADQCAVCIEPYKVSDVIRVLPCKHVFHKSCVDPWLLDQRSCPMCKMDILRAFGMHLNGSQESVPQDAESGILTSTPAIEETEHLSTSEEQGAVGGVKIVLYQHPSVHYGQGDSSPFPDCELSSEGSLDLCASPVAQCHVECNSQIMLEKDTSLHTDTSLAGLEPGKSPSRSVTLDDLQSSEDECNEIDSLMTGLPKHNISAVSPGCSGLKSLRSSSSGSNVSHGVVDTQEH